jgi:hypothetical protein
VHYAKIVRPAFFKEDFAKRNNIAPLFKESRFLLRRAVFKDIRRQRLHAGIPVPVFLNLD